MNSHEIEFLRYVVTQAGHHIRQYRHYAREMKKTGRGFEPSAETSPQSIEFGIDEAIRILNCEQPHVK